MRSILPWLVVVGLVAPGCNCGRSKLAETADCANDPSLCPVDGGTVDVPAASDGGSTVEIPGTCDTGAVTGRVCAPDQQTRVNGAAVSVDATDCNGNPVHVQTTSAADGSFELDGVPTGQVTVHAALGAFQQDTAVSVSANQTTAIPDNQLCVAQKTVRIAVVTGPGDQIENLLQTLQLQFTTYAADSASYASSAKPFLLNLQQMEQYDLIFIDCGAAHTNGQDDFGSSASQIEQNLAAYVANGGSLYASDWALLFALYAHPGSLDFLTRTGSAVTDPLYTHDLMGYAPQTVSATIADPQLAQFLGKGQVSVNFPKQTGVSSLHWGLMQSVDPAAHVLVSAPSVQVCDGTTQCSSSGGSATNVPLAVELKVTAAGTRGGNIVYTSFHNIAQSGNDVAQILKYLVLHL